MYDEFQAMHGGSSGFDDNNRQNMEIRYKTKISILEAKEKQAYKKLERAQQMVTSYEREKREL